MHAALTVRKLKPGSFEAWREAWQPKEWPEGVQGFILRSVSDPDEVIAFGLFEGNIEEMKSMMDKPEMRAEEDARQARMAEHVESVGADGIYEVVERVGAQSVHA
jgi:hypothetical protein